MQTPSLILGKNPQSCWLNGAALRRSPVALRLPAILTVVAGLATANGQSVNPNLLATAGDSGTNLFTASTHPVVDRDVPVITLPPADLGPAVLGKAEESMSEQATKPQMSPVYHGRLVTRYDTVKFVVDSMVRDWTMTMEPSTVRGYNSAPAAWLNARIGHDSLVRQYVAAALATPGLTATDRAWVLRTTIEALLMPSPAPTPAHVALARELIAHMRLLPSRTVALELFIALSNLMQAESRIGNVGAAVHSGLEAYALVAAANYETRRAMFIREDTFLRLAMLLSFQPAGQKTLDSLIATLKPLLTIPPAEAAQDSLLHHLTPGMVQAFDHAVTIAMRFGRPAVPFVATHWVNQQVPGTLSSEAPNARIKSLDDGVSRLILFGFLGCASCAEIMKRFQKITATLPPGEGVESYEVTRGFWGDTLAAPDVEAEHLRRFFVEGLHYTFPIAIWAGPLKATPDGFTCPKRSPTLQEYSLAAGGRILLIDGHGILRWEATLGSTSDIVDPRSEIRQILDQVHAISSTTTTPATIPAAPSAPRPTS